MARVEWMSASCSGSRPVTPDPAWCARAGGLPPCIALRRESRRPCATDRRSGSTRGPRGRRGRADGRSRARGGARERPPPSGPVTRGSARTETSIQPRARGHPRPAPGRRRPYIHRAPVDTRGRRQCARPARPGRAAPTLRRRGAIARRPAGAPTRWCSRHAWPAAARPSRSPSTRPARRGSPGTPLPRRRVRIRNRGRIGEDRCPSGAA